MADVPLDPDLRALIAIAFADLLTESLQGAAVVRATLLMLIDIVRNVFARKLFRDGLAAAEQFCSECSANGGFPVGRRLSNP